MSFDINTSSPYASFKLWSFPLIKYSGLLAQAFFFAFAVLVLLSLFSLSGIFIVPNTIKLVFFSFFCMMAFFQISLFTEMKIRRPASALPLGLQSSGAEERNLADFLGPEACSLVEESIRLCRKKKLVEIMPEALLYAGLQESRDIQLLAARFGIDIGKLKSDIKNFLEKQPRAEKFSLVFSESFQGAMKEAVKTAGAMRHAAVEEKEILVALAKTNAFFKQVLVDYDLKPEDVENLAQWLDSAETLAEGHKRFWEKRNLAKLGSIGRHWASGFTINLDQFSVDWTKWAKRHALHATIGHEKELEQLENILAKSSYRNALIVGEPGSGRKSIVQALAQRCWLEQSLPELNSKRVIELDMVALTSRVQDQETLELAVDEIMQEALRAGSVILVIDGIDNYVQHNARALGAVDISGILSKYLATPSFQFIGITSFDGLHRRMESNSALLEYFAKVEVAEISEAQALQIIQNLAVMMEQKYRMLIIYPSVREIINLAAKYFPSMPFPKKAIDILEEAVVYATRAKEKVLFPRHVAKIVSEKSQIPVGKMEFKEKSVLMNLEHLIHEKIVNQKEAVSEISIAMRRARAGIGSKKRPMGTFIFLGPTGVGKTETAKALAEIYFGGEDKIIRLDMSEFQAIADIPRLIGAVSPVEQQGLLTTPVRENPFSLVLLDEVEKAHPNILNLFLQVLDEGHITDGQGRKVAFSNTIIICTSNAGAEKIFKAAESGEVLEKDALFAFLFEQGLFRPEFINRFDAAVVFEPLTRENLMDIAQLMLEKLKKSLDEKEIALVITELLKEKIVELSYKPQFGAREMRRVLQDTVENAVAKALLSDEIAKGDKVEINPENFEVVKIS